MKDEEFAQKYHDYMTRDRGEAQQEADSVTLEHGEHPCVVGFPFPTVTGMMYCLMLPESAALIENIKKENGCEW